MKSNFKLTGEIRNPLRKVLSCRMAVGLAFVLIPLIAGFLGCKNSVPSYGTYPTPQSVLDWSTVANFNSDAVTVNPDLFEASNPPTYKLKTAGGSVTAVNDWSAYIAISSNPPTVQNTTVTLGGSSILTIPMAPWLDTPGPSGSSSDYAFHVTGALLDPGDYSSFDSVKLQAQMEGGGFYDASFFNGVKYHLKVGSDDTTLYRFFSVPVYQTTSPVGGGGCMGGPRLCDDSFAADFSSGTGGQWKQFSYKFTDLHQLQPGVITNPPTLSGVNLQQIFFLEWDEGRNNQPGISYFDFWVDDIEFFK